MVFCQSINTSFDLEYIKYLIARNMRLLVINERNKFYIKVVLESIFVNDHQ